MAGFENCRDELSVWHYYLVHVLCPFLPNYLLSEIHAGH